MDGKNEPQNQCAACGLPVIDGAGTNLQVTISTGRGISAEAHGWLCEVCCSVAEESELRALEILSDATQEILDCGGGDA